MVKVVWTDNAIKDLDDIGNYIAKNSVRYAGITVEKLFGAVDILEDYPRAGKMIPQFQNERIREIIRGNYRIAYKIVSEQRIDILTVHHTARLIENTIDPSEIR
jgi:addiction module RelE/StbE family toxin